MEKDPLTNREESEQNAAEPAVDARSADSSEEGDGLLEELRAKKEATRDQLLRARAELERLTEKRRSP